MLEVVVVPRNAGPLRNPAQRGDLTHPAQIDHPLDAERGERLLVALLQPAEIVGAEDLAALDFAPVRRGQAAKVAEVEDSAERDRAVPRGDRHTSKPSRAE